MHKGGGANARGRTDRDAGGTQGASAAVSRKHHLRLHQSGSPGGRLAHLPPPQVPPSSPHPLHCVAVGAKAGWCNGEVAPRVGRCAGGRSIEWGQQRPRLGVRPGPRAAHGGRMIV
eukprot:scaffold4203_cov295-Prasinococcus_capsulatus_cf.AAC.4